MKWYSALNRKEILTHPIAWMNSENIMLSEISHTHTDNYIRSPELSDLKK